MLITYYFLQYGVYLNFLVQYQYKKLKYLESFCTFAN